jgi:hypothetical protein
MSGPGNPENWDVIGKGVSGIAGVISLGVAMFLRQKFLEKREEKRENPNMHGGEGNVSEWLKSFLQAMTEDRRELIELIKDLASEVRQTNSNIDKMGSKVEGNTVFFQHAANNLGGALGRIESKADAILQRPYQRGS